MRVKAWLTGHEFDLAVLAELLRSGQVRVSKDDHGFFLSSDELDTLQPGIELHESASRLLAVANGLARATHPTFHPVGLSGRYSDGDHIHSVVVADAMVVRSRMEAAGIVVRVGDHETPTQTAPGTDWSLLMSNPNVKEALTIMGHGPLGWNELYKVFEIVRDDATARSITELGWATHAEIDAFRASANRPDVSGATARHARMSGNPPRRRMSDAEARSFIGRLVTAWIGANQ